VQQARETARQPGRQPGVELAVHQHEHHPRRDVAAVRPGVVGAALDDDVARRQRHLGVVEDQGDLALEHDPVVDRRRPVHRRLQAPLVQVAGRELVDPDLRAALRRRDGERALRRLGRLDGGDPGRRALGVPDLVEPDAVVR
jgi:hypothetical protein